MTSLFAGGFLKETGRLVNLQAADLWMTFAIRKKCENAVRSVELEEKTGTFLNLLGNVGMQSAGCRILIHVLLRRAKQTDHEVHMHVRRWAKMCAPGSGGGRASEAKPRTRLISRSAPPLQAAAAFHQRFDRISVALSNSIPPPEK